MAHTHILERPWVRTAEHLLAHIAAVTIGLILLALALALGASIVMVPLGVMVGFLGVALVVGGLTTPINPK
jgi:hypothetical protein